jgi:6-phosphogluconolactonase/glucosamine-6-phosphate isomerase/deaminase
MDRQSLIGLNHFKNKDNILVIETPSVQKAHESVSEILQKYCDFKTALFLSGGKTTKKLYEYLVDQKSLKAGAVGQTEEMFGRRNHKKSSELMISESGVIKYFEDQNIRFYPILETGESLSDITRNYDEALRFISKYFPKSVGILGVGEDGHTAGIPAGIKSQNSKIKSSEIVKKMIEDQSSLISSYELDGLGAWITMNFNALSILDLIIILVLGQEKREALAQMFKEVHSAGSGLPGEIENCPARFYLRPEIAAKTILITDQNI